MTGRPLQPGVRVHLQGLPPHRGTRIPSPQIHPAPAPHHSWASSCWPLPKGAHLHAIRTGGRPWPRSPGLHAGDTLQRTSSSPDPSSFRTAECGIPSVGGAQPSCGGGAGGGDAALCRATGGTRPAWLLSTEQALDTQCGSGTPRPTGGRAASRQQPRPWRTLTLGSHQCSGTG